MYYITIFIRTITLGTTDSGVYIKCCKLVFMKVSYLENEVFNG